MAKAKRLPSGSWRVQVQKDGIRQSFTSKNRREAELLAAEWMAGNDTPTASTLSLSKALTEYIDSCDGILSPSTIKGYDAIVRRIRSYDISRRNISAITPADLQRFIKKLSSRYSAKSVHNTYGLITATFAFLGLPQPRGINLPPIAVKSYPVPNEDEIRRVLDIVRDTPMEIPVMLGICGLRRSEIAGMTTEDIDAEMRCIHIHQAVVEDANGDLVKKGTKTRNSTRIVTLPDFILNKLLDLPPGPVTDLTPKAITCRWEHVRNKAGIDTTFHGLRHFSVSLAHALGMKDQYLMHRHGFSTDSTMKRIYRNEIDTYEKEMNDMITDYYEKAFG